MVESDSHLFKNKYRIPSSRLPNWDYSWPGCYFVTICTQNRNEWFGEIIDHRMILSDMGEIADDEWYQTFDVRSDMNLTMGEFVIMPNHFHAVITIGENAYNSRRDALPCVSKHPSDATIRDARHCVSTNAETINTFGPQCKNLASIVRGFKIGVTKRCSAINPLFGWQPRYYDHIIRNEEELSKISQYIKDNPMNWEEDELYIPR